MHADGEHCRYLSRSADGGHAWSAPGLMEPEESKLTGFIMVEQIKSVDFAARRAKRIERGDEGLLAEVLAILDACIY